MSTTQDRPSGIPKASRLPRPTVTIPRLPSPSSSVSSIRPVASRESLSGGLAASRDLHSPLRSPVSSRTSIQSVSSGAESRPFVRHCASKDQLRPGAPKVHSCSRHAAPPPPKPIKNSSSSSRRWSTITHNPTLQYKPWAEPLPGDPDRDNYVRETSQGEDMPQSLLASYLNGTLGHSRISDSAEDCSLPDLTDLKLRRAGTSLTERTVETLSQLPSSPAGSRKSSAFYGDSRRCSLADVTASSRPGSSYNSELSSGLVSPVATKAPTSSSRPTMPPSRYSMSHLPDSRFPLPVKRSCGTVHGRTCSKPAPEKKLVRPKPHRSARNQSISALTTASGSEPSGPMGGVWDGTIRPPIPRGVENAADEPDFRKSSTSLRDHIARAKAAKRAALKQAGGDEISSVGYDTAGMSPATGFDESVHNDPFNLRNGGGNKILKQRVSDARTSGRLNIAALGLKEVPAEVMKMYDFESIQESGGIWSDSVDLKRFIAADNELENLDESMFPDHEIVSCEENTEGKESATIFGGLESMDLHGNKIVRVPVGLRRLAHLTSLNLSSNRLDNDCLSVISQMSSLRDLKLAKNCLAGPLDACLADLTLLETLDIHDNHISALPSEFENLKRLRILGLSENNFESIAFESLAKLPLTELDLKRNKLSGTLIEDPIDSLPHLQTFDVSSNRLTRLVPEGASVDFPVLHTLLLSMNRLQELPDMSTWTNLLTLTADTNSIGAIPNGFASLRRLRQADFSSNDIKVVPPEVARMDDLTMLRLSGNPLRERKFAAASADAIKAILASRLESVCEAAAIEETPEAIAEGEQHDEAVKSDDEEQFSTPPTSALPSPSETKEFSSLESSVQIRTGGILDISRTESSALTEELCARLAAEHPVYNAQLHHSLYVCIPGALSAFAETLTSLALGHNQMVGETYLVEELKLPSLSELNLTSNQITSLGPLTKFLRAPSLEKIDISMNRLSTLPLDLKENFPKMMVLLASNNRLVELDPASIRGLQIVDVSGNEITHLDPRIGLLGGHSGLQRLELMGNRIRVPRWNVLESGTEATMRWLRGRVPAADRAAWKAEQGDDGVDDEDELD